MRLFVCGYCLLLIWGLRLFGGFRLCCFGFGFVLLMFGFVFGGYCLFALVLNYGLVWEGVGCVCFAVLFICCSLLTWICDFDGCFVGFTVFV